MIKRCLITGLLVWLPIWATLMIIRFLIHLFDGTLALIPQPYQPVQLFGYDIPGLGFIVTLVVLFLTGLLVRNFIGRTLLKYWERLLSRIPLIRSIYSAVKQVANALMQPKGDAFRRVVLVEYPRKGVWSVGFLTAGKLDSLPTRADSKAVFIPTTPNPTSGFLIIAPRDEIIELDISIEEGFKMIISLGVVTPS